MLVAGAGGSGGTGGARSGSGAGGAMAGLSVRDPAVDRSLRSVFGEAAGAGPPPGPGKGQGRAGAGGGPAGFPPSPSGPVPAALTGGTVCLRSGEHPV